MLYPILLPITLQQRFWGLFLLKHCFLLLLPLVLRRISHLSTITSPMPNPKPISHQHSMSFNCTTVLQSLKHLFFLFIECSSFPQSKHLHMHRFAPALIDLQMDSARDTWLTHSVLPTSTKQLNNCVKTRDGFANNCYAIILKCAKYENHLSVFYWVIGRRELLTKESQASCMDIHRYSRSREAFSSLYFR